VDLQREEERNRSALFDIESQASTLRAEVASMQADITSLKQEKKELLETIAVSQTCWKTL